MSPMPEEITQAGEQSVVEAHLFDVYHGPGLPAGSKSCGITLTFRSKERTLTDAEVAEIEARIVA